MSQPRPTITSAQYNVETGVLTIYGENFRELNGGLVNTTKIRFDNDSSGMALSLTGVGINGDGTEIEINLTQSDQDNLIDTNIITENGIGTYNLVAQEGWMEGWPTISDTTGNPITVRNYTEPTPSFTVSYGSETVNDGEVVAAGDGVTITGENLTPGQDYLFGIYLDVNGDGNYFPGSVDTPDGSKKVITLTSDNPTFTESEYTLGEISDSLQGQEYSFYFQRVEEVDNGDPNNPSYQPTTEQFTGTGLNKTTPVTFTLVNDEYVAPSGGGGGGPSPVNFSGVGDTSDNVEGTSLNDRLRGLGGNDILNGLDGDDFINGNVGDDYIIGGRGNDILKGGSENDELRGGNGNDFTNGNRGNDVVFGGVGDDIVRGGSEDDIINGGAGDDQLYGDKGNDQLTGGLGADVFHLSTGVDVIKDFEVGVDGLSGLSVTNITYSDTEDGALVSYDGGSTLLVGVDSSVLV